MTSRPGQPLRLTTRLGPLGFVLLHWLLAPCAAAAPAGDTSDLAASAGDLGGNDAEARQAGFRRLWSAGPAAQPLLRRAAAGGEAKAAGEAAFLRELIDAGIAPDTPEEVVARLRQSRGPDPEEKREAVRALAKRATINPGERWDERALREVLWVVNHDPGDDESTRFGILAELQTRSIRKGRGAAANDPAPTAAVTAFPVPVEAEAAYLVVRGGSDREVAAARREADAGGPLSDERAWRLICLLRAGGDLTAATRLAGRKVDEHAREPRADYGRSLVDPWVTKLNTLQEEAGDWGRRADQLVRHGPGGTKGSSESDWIGHWGVVAALRRLAGDEAGLQEALAKAAGSVSRDRPDVAKNSELAACEYFYNDRPGEGMELLDRHKQPGVELKFVAPLLRFADVPRLLEQAKALPPQELAVAQARAAGLLYFMGKRAEARQLLAEAEPHLLGADSPAVWSLLARAAWETGQRDVADDRLARALEAGERGSDPNDPAEWCSDLLRDLGVESLERAQEWWWLLRTLHRDEPAPETVRRLRALAAGEMRAAEWDALGAGIRRVAPSLDADDRDPWMAMATDALAAAGRDGEATACCELWVELSAGSSAALTRRADLFDGRGDWARAAEDYGKAWDADQSRPLPLLLRGRAMTHLGDERDREEGRQLVRLAHLLPQGDPLVRTWSEQGLTRRGLGEDARLERDLLLRVCTNGYPDRVGSARLRDGDDAYRRGDYLAAADAWDRVFLRHYQWGVGFREPGEALRLPARTHRARALGSVRAGRFDDAVKEAQLALKDFPADAEGVASVVSALGTAGRHAESDALYGQGMAVYGRLCDQLPDSARAAQLLSHFQSACGRDAEAALSNAAHAAGLDPTSAEMLADLAVLHFKRGDVAKAIAEMRRCAELDPRCVRYRRDLEKFKAAQR